MSKTSYGEQKGITYIPFAESKENVKNKPGRKPTLPDLVLTSSELGRRNNQRRRNREAAQRLRKKRLNKRETLEKQVEYLNQKLKVLINYNATLKRQLAILHKQTSTVQPVYKKTPSISNTDMPEESDLSILPKIERVANIQIVSGQLDI